MPPYLRWCVQQAVVCYQVPGAGPLVAAGAMLPRAAWQAASARGITSPAGLLVARLKAGDQPPTGKGRKGKGEGLTGADYIGGEYSDLIKH